MLKGVIKKITNSFKNDKGDPFVGFRFGEIGHELTIPGVKIPGVVYNFDNIEAETRPLGGYAKK